MKSTKILQIPFEIPPNWFEIHRTRSLTHRLGSQFHRIRSLTHRFDSKLNRIRSSNDRRYSTEIRLTSVLSPKNIEVHRRLLPTVLIRSISNCTEVVYRYITQKSNSNVVLKLHEYYIFL